MEGRCQCGAVRFKTDADKPLQVYICHCLECRWQSASSYGLSALFPVSGVHFTSSSQEHLTTWTRTTFQGNVKECWFCKTCGTRLYHHCPGQAMMTVKAGALEGLTKEMLESGTHIWAKRAITPIPAGAEAYDEEPPGEPYDDDGKEK